MFETTIMKKNNYFLTITLFFCQLFAAENNLLLDEQLDDGIPLGYEPIFLVSEREITSVANSEDPQASILENGTTYTFTNCATTGASGPTQNKIDIEYSGTSLAGQVTSIGGMQKWTVPGTGVYYFEVKGAMGGSQNSTYRGGYGAVLSGSIELQAGEELLISIGQKGLDDGDSPGGGGATAVAKGTHFSNALPLIVAGGGGGRSQRGSANYAAINGQSGINGGAAGGHYQAGSNGNGGSYGGHSNNSGSGAGFYTGTDNSTSTTASHARGFRQGYRGSTMAGPQGGFGGGGAGSNSNNDWDKGGAGGYSGGAQAFDSGQGGGGGSYLASSVSNQIVLGGNNAVNAGHGRVTITTNVDQGNSIPVAENQSVVGNEDEEIIITLTGTDGDGGGLTYNLESNPSYGVAVQEYTSALDFDGSNDVVIIPDAPAFDFGTGAFSVAAWFKKEGQGRGDIINLKGAGGDFGFLLNSNETFGIYFNSWAVTNGSQFTLNEWHHAVFVRDNNGNLKTYIDGQSDGSGFQSANMSSNQGDLRIGSNHNGGSTTLHHDGQIDEVAFWNTELTPTEILALYNNGSPQDASQNSGNYSSSGFLTGYWKFDEGQGTTINDQTSNDNDGTISGASWVSQGSSNTISYLPNSNYNGYDSFTFSVSDGIDASHQNATIEINILPVNDNPIINSSPILNIVEGHSYEYAVQHHDIDGDFVTLTTPNKPDWIDIINTNSHSLDFDGNNDNVVANINLIVEEKTMSAWVKLGTLNQGGGGLVSLQTTGGGVFDAIVYNETGQGWGFGSDHFRRTNWSGITESSTDWIYMTAVYSDYDYKLYRNGVLIHSTSSFAVNSFPTNSQVLVGQRHSGGGNAFLDAHIEGVEVWGRALSQSEIQSNMNNPLEGDEQNLIGYWSYDGGSGNQVIDHSENNFNGTINGASWSTDIAFSSTYLIGSPSYSDGGLHNVVLQIDDGNGGYSIQDFNIAVAVQHLDIVGESGFRILSSPVSGPIFGDLLEELWTQGSEGSDHEGADANVWTFDNGWVPVTDLYNDNLDAGEGFVIYVFSDTDFDGDDDLPVTIGIDGVGTMNESAISINSNSSDWNLIGNPYGLHVNIDQLLTDNSSKFHSTVYKIDDVNPGYRTHNGVVGDIDQGLIKPFDGFWIQAGPEGHSFDFTENSIRKGHLVYDGGARTATNESTGSAVFTFTSGQYTSSVYLSFTTDGDINLDPADAKRIIPMSPEEHLTSMIRESSKSLSINNLPFALTDDISIELDAMYLAPTEEGYETESRQASLTWDIMDLPEGISLSLVNNMNGQVINLYGFPSANVNLPSKGGFAFPDEIMQNYPFVGDAQFTLSISSDIASSVKDEEIVPDQITLHNAYPNPFNPSTIISFDIIDMSHVSLNIFDLTGRQVASLVNETLVPGYHQISWNPGLLPSGVYLVELISNEKSFNQKITYIK